MAERIFPTAIASISTPGPLPEPPPTDLPENPLFDYGPTVDKLKRVIRSLKKEGGSELTKSMPDQSWGRHLAAMA